MHATKILQKCLGDALGSMHTLRSRVSLRAVEAMIHGSRLGISRPEIAMETSAHIENQEKRLRQAMLDGDVEVLNQLLSDELIFTNHVGLRLRKVDDLATHRSGLLIIERLDVTCEPVVRLLGDSAIVLTIAELAGGYAGEAFGGTFAYTRVWHRGEGEWQLHAAHCSLVQSPIA